MAASMRVCIDKGSERMDYRWRLASYNISTMPYRTKVGFAKSGFHYTGYENQLECISCNFKYFIGVLKNPYNEHKDISPKCSFIQRTESNRYMPFNVNQEDLTVRRNTFQEHNLLKASSLSAAGFYYVGPKDMVRCFSCGIGLMEWGKDDDPFTVHKTVSPYCIYIYGSSLQLMGISIPSNVRCEDTDLLRKSISVFTDDHDKGHRKEIVKMTTSHPLFQNLSNLGFSANEIRQEMRIRIHKTGHNFETAYEFLEAFWKRHQLLKKLRFQSKIITENKHVSDVLLCKMCRKPRQTASILFLPCGHLVTCATCALTLIKCFLCDIPIAGLIRVSRF